MGRKTKKPRKAQKKLKKAEKRLPKAQKKLKEIRIKDVEKLIKATIAEVAEIDEKKIGPETRFIEDLGMDSMMGLEILAYIEKKYKIEIPEESFPKIVNLKKVMKLTKKLLTKYGYKWV